MLRFIIFWLSLNLHGGLLYIYDNSPSVFFKRKLKHNWAPIKYTSE